MPVNQECFLSFSHPLLVNQQLQRVAHALGTRDARLYITPPMVPALIEFAVQFPHLLHKDTHPSYRPPI